jgi:light-regulated signal transduction histidine kinase (bacteriophytochrome)
LERRVEERTAELERTNEALQVEIAERKRTEEMLARYAEELKRSNTELEQFAYIASHDLQEPLRMVTSYLKLLERRYKGQLDSDADDFIYYAVDGASRMQSLIEGLLAYSRVSTRGGEFEAVRCEEVFDQALRNLVIAVEDSGAEVTHDPLPEVSADELQLGQLFQNLIGNAIKFHGADPPRIHVTAEEGDGEWVFSVSDNGIGFDPEQAERAFAIFQRLHHEEKYSGSGIGLALCKRIVERHGGRIWAESQPGGGSVFYFALPDSL